MRRVLLLIAAAAFAFGAAHAFTLTVAQGSDVVSLSPHKTNDQPSARVMRQIYDTLVVQTEELELEPGLAESWTQIDDPPGSSPSVPGVVFHNGDTLTARRRSSRSTASVTRRSPPGAFLVGFIEDIVVVDDLTVRITTDAPFVPDRSRTSRTPPPRS
jgi:peptide/nickel transport system substrate-binding protein